MIARVLFALVAASAVTAAQAADIEAGKQKASVCQGCHGEDGNSKDPQFPRLAGQYPDYLLQALIDYQSGARKNPIMAPFVQNLSRSDMENLAAYFASRPNGLVVKP